MTALIDWDASGHWRDLWICQPDIRRVMRAQGVAVGQWTPRELGGAADVVTVLSTYADPLRDLGLHTPVDSLADPARGACAWRRHAARRSGTWRQERAGFVLVLDGSLLLHLRSRSRHLGLLCEAGDWVLLPPDVDCLIDGGEDPDFDVLSLCLPARRRPLASAAMSHSMDDVVAELAERIGFGTPLSADACAIA